LSWLSGVPSDLSFDSGRANLRPDLRPVLDQFAQGLDPGTRVLVVGHTDSTGSQVLNEQLSLQRAQTVRDYLYSRGVPAARLEVAGRAALEPVADNATQDGRAKNRRVEIFLREPPA
jgi:outer membrane protein OmpA-like peptidoglycan-associated protein